MLCSPQLKGAGSPVHQRVHHSQRFPDLPRWQQLRFAKAYRTDYGFQDRTHQALFAPGEGTGLGRPASYREYQSRPTEGRQRHFPRIEKRILQMEAGRTQQEMGFPSKSLFLTICP